MVGYFLDTYALIEIVRGKPAFKKYVTTRSYTSIANLYELYYHLLKSFDEVFSQDKYLRFRHQVIAIEDRHIFKAAAFRHAHKTANISYIDALGYAIAESEGLRFVTGDKAFKGWENVEFVQ